MTKSANSTTTTAEGWQQQCWAWARNGELFEVMGVRANHLAFCKELCAAYNYECHYESNAENSTAIFKPLSN